MARRVHPLRARAILSGVLGAVALYGLTASLTHSGADADRLLRSTVVPGVVLVVLLGVQYAALIAAHLEAPPERAWSTRWMPMLTILPRVRRGGVLGYGRALLASHQLSMGWLVAVGLLCYVLRDRDAFVESQTFAVAHHWRGVVATCRAATGPAYRTAWRSLYEHDQATAVAVLRETLSVAASALTDEDIQTLLVASLTDVRAAGIELLGAREGAVPPAPGPTRVLVMR